VNAKATATKATQIYQPKMVTSQGKAKANPIKAGAGIKVERSKDVSNPKETYKIISQI
jgi:hypothetical protein